jgi:AbrB family looped-hinge helix DNA binding protein
MIQCSLDRFGRLVVPKEIRDRHGWGPGTTLLIRDCDQGVMLEPAIPQETGRGLIMEGGHLVYDAVWTDAANQSGSDPVRQAIEDDRRERDERHFPQ